MPSSPTPNAVERDQLARAVLRQFPAAKSNGELQFLHNHGGFSGASLWRVEARVSRLCLRAWPPNTSLEAYLPNVHRLMEQARAAELLFVPAIECTASGDTIVQHASRFWDLALWMPGRADFHIAPSPHRLAQACKALARLHEAWKPAATLSDSCPAIKRRIEKLREWSMLAASGGQPSISRDPCDPCAESAERSRRLLEQWTPKITLLLAPWRTRAVSVQPCHCDLWHDHVLFEDDDVVGLIDYGSVKVDHVAVDLARLLGSLAGDDQALWAAGLSGYRMVRSLSAEEESLVHVLDRTGTLLALATWLKWLYYEARSFPDRQAVARRLAGLVDRVASWA